MASRSIVLLLCALVLIALVGCATRAPIPLDHTAPAAESATLSQRLNAIVERSMESEHLAGASVVVLRGDEVLLRRSYGFADLALRVPASNDTTYRVLGSALGAAVMQQVERGKLSLDAEANSLLPEFPWQNRRVTLRQLMNATSGLPDFHYLGDAHLAQRAVPKARDEVTALFAGRPFTHEPGERLQWTISGFHLTGVILERITGEDFSTYLQREVIARAQLPRTYPCGDRDITPSLASAYEWAGGRHRNHALESASLYPFIADLCATASDSAELMRALRHPGRIVSAESYEVMKTAVGAAATSDRRSGVGLREIREGEHIGYGTTGSLMGYSTGVVDFPKEDVTIAVLANTASQGAGRIARALAREVFGVPQPPVPSDVVEGSAATPVELAPEERSRYVGTYRVQWTGTPGPMSNWCRTLRVFESGERLMIQSLGDEPELLTYMSDSSFHHPGFRSGRVTFADVATGEKVVKISGPTFSLEGSRIGDDKVFFRTSCESER